MTPESILVAERFIAGAIVRSPGDADDILAAVPVDLVLNYGPRCVLEAAASLRLRNALPQMEAIHIEITSADRGKDFASSGGLASFLSQLRTDHPTAVGWEYYAGIVREAAALRRLTSLAAQLGSEASSPIESASDIAARYSKALEDATVEPNGSDPVLLAEALPDSIDEIRKRVSRANGVVGSGLDTIDRWVPGFEPGQLIVVAARTGVGKTALALKTALHVSGGVGKPVYFASLEMSRHEIAQRLGCMITGKSMNRLKSGHADPGELAEFERLTHMELGRAKLWIDDNSSLRVEQIVAAARKVKRKQGLSLLVVDYLQLVSPSDRRSERREQIEHTSRTLKKAARELSCPVITLAQLNREVESRSDPKPRLSDIREAGGVEQDADVVLLLWKKPGQNADEPVHEIGVHIAKQRNGPTGEDDLDYVRACTRFEDRYR